MSEEIEFGIETYGKVKHSEYGWIYAYETDGFGNYNLMDDANVPSLLSIPYLGYHDVNDLVYRNTRKFVLSPDNPYDASGQSKVRIYRQWIKGYLFILPSIIGFGIFVAYPLISSVYYGSDGM